MISERISDYILFINENFEFGYQHFDALIHSSFELERCKPHKAVRHQRM